VFYSRFISYNRFHKTDSIRFHAGITTYRILMFIDLLYYMKIYHVLVILIPI